jgi:hypothetical protein
MVANYIYLVIMTNGSSAPRTSPLVWTNDLGVHTAGPMHGGWGFISFVLIVLYVTNATRKGLHSAFALKKCPFQFLTRFFLKKKIDL